MKKNFKRISAILLSLAMLTLSGCSDKTETDDTLTDTNVATESETDAVTEVVDEFNKELNAMDFVKGIEIGWNLGNTMDAHDGKSGLQTETCWGNPETTEEIILAVKDAGFNAVRIPTTWGYHMDENNVVDTEWMDRVQTVVNYAYDNDMYVILNTHHEGNWLVPQPDQEAVVTEKYIALWEQIAERFKDYDERLIFEGLNEPKTDGSAKEWQGGTPEESAVVNNLLVKFVETVRASGGNNELRFLMVTPYAASVANTALDNFVIPEDDRLIVSVHSYTPYNMALNRNSDISDFNASNMIEIDNLMKMLTERYISQGIPVIMGEFGSMNKLNNEDRAKHAQYYIASAKEQGIPCFWWDNGSDCLPSQGEGFMIIDRNAKAPKFPEIVDGLMNGLTSKE